MTRLGSRAALLACALLAGPAAAEEAIGPAAIGEFVAACLPQRQSFAGAQEQAGTAGWTAIKPKRSTELTALLAKSGEVLAELVENPDELVFDHQSFVKEVRGRDLHLLVARVGTGPIGTPGFISCYLYDFEATAPYAAAPLTAVIGSDVTETVATPELESFTWREPTALPGTWDVYMTFIPEGSRHQEHTAFAGVSLLITSSEAATR